MENIIINTEGVDVSKFHTMSIKDLEHYGMPIQESISDSVDAILENTRGLDLGKTQGHLSDLTETSTVITKKLDSIRIVKPLLGAKRWLSKFDTVSNQLDTVRENIDNEVERLNKVLDALFKNKEMLDIKTKELEIVQSELYKYANFLQQNPDEDPDGLRLLATSGRLNLISSTLELSKHELVKTVILIKENKEITYQLREAQLNVVPVFKTMMINSLALETNKRAIKLKNTLQEVTARATIDSARQIEQDAKKLIEGRKIKVIDPKTLNEANDLLIKAVENINQAMHKESEENLKLVETTLQANIKLKELLQTSDEVFTVEEGSDSDGQ